jgi:hypothetical protein
MHNIILENKTNRKHNGTKSKNNQIEVESISPVRLLTMVRQNFLFI